MTHPAAPTPVSDADFEVQLRALRTDARNVALPGLAATYVALGGLVALALHVDAWWGYLLLAGPIGHLQYRVTLSGHEAVHKTLAFPLWLNEALGVVGQALVGVNFASYRVQHLDHHRATTLHADPDGHIYGGIIAAERGWRRVATWIFGTFVELAIKIWQKGVGSLGRTHAARASVTTWRYSALCSLAVLTTQAALLAGLWRVSGHWYAYGVVWIGPLFVIAVFLNRTRILVEHGLPLLDGLPPVARSLPTVDVVPPAWERWIFAPFYFNYHCSHHLHLTVPHYNLPRLRELLRARAAAGYYEVEGSYLRAVRRTMRT